MFSQYTKVVKGLAPAADRFNTSPVSDAVNMKDYERLTILVIHQGGTTGKGTLTVEECTAADGTGAAAIAFRYRRMTTGASDTVGAVTVAAATGIDTVPAEDTIIEIEVDARDLTEGSNWVRLKITEAVDDPVNGCVVLLLHGPQGKGGRYLSDVNASAIA